MFLLRFFRTLEFDIILNKLFFFRDNHIIMASFRYIRDNESVKTE